MIGTGSERKRFIHSKPRNSHLKKERSAAMKQGIISFLGLGFFLIALALWLHGRA